MPQRPITPKPFLRGLIAAVDPWGQPEGSFPRGSNLLLTRRGSLDTCDGTGVLLELNGAIQSAIGRILANLYFAPIGVPGYYLTLKERLGAAALGAPTNLAASAGGVGGTLATGTYFYVVTAIDAQGNETTKSNEVSVAVTLGQVVTLTWNIVPNAAGYNVYRGTGAGSETLLTGSLLPVPQPAAGSLTATFVDKGTSGTTTTAPPTTNTSRQTALYKMPAISPTSSLPLTYTDANIVALFPPPGTVLFGGAGATSGASGGQTGNRTSPTQFTNPDNTVFTDPSWIGPFAFVNPASAIDGNPNTFAESDYAAGDTRVQSSCRWFGFAAAPAGGQATLSVDAELPNYSSQSGAPGSGIVNYSVNNGATFVQLIHFVGVTARQTVSVALPAGQDLTKVIVQSIVDSKDGVTDFRIYEIFVTTTGGTVPSSGTPSSTGGIVGGISLIPQMVPFTNRVAIALGNGFPPQIYSDPTTPVNPAQVLAIATVASSGGDTVTITLSAAPTTFVPVGSNVLIAGVANSAFNGVFVVIGGTATNQASPGTTLIVRNTIAAGASAGGTVTVTTVPIYSTFVPAFPQWVAKTAYPVGSTVQPTVAQPGANAYFFVALEAGTSGAAEPTWPTGLGEQVADGPGAAGATPVLWKNAGLVNQAAPPPPGAAHLAVYAGFLWAWNTWPVDTAPLGGATGPGQVGLDGPTSLRMSDLNNPFSWNPVNQDYVDKDDGSEGMGLKAFTATAMGIPPEGSLFLFKNYATYQVRGVFGDPNFAIQRALTDLGCVSPRTIQFLPHYGLVRYTHLGFASFDGVYDKVISEEIRPYLFPQNDVSLQDILPVDSNWFAVAWACQTSTPPMFVAAMPIGNSGGQLTRIFCYDLVLRAWAAPADLPFSISTMDQFRPEASNPVTVFGGYGDGVVQRWQAGDTQWYGLSAAPLVINWNFRTAEVFADPSQRLYIRRLLLRFINTTSLIGLTVTPFIDGNQDLAYLSPTFSTGDIELDVAIQQVALRFSALIAGSGQVEFDRVSWLVTEKTVGVPEQIT